MTTVLEVAAELYGLPLADFTPARDARAKAAKGTPLAAQVKALRKPATAAWVVDLLVRYATDQVDQLISVGAALREAQEGMDAAQLRELTKQRRQLTAAVTTQARGLAREHGLRVTPAVADQVEATLTAAMVDAGGAAAVRSGLLVSPLAATGVDRVDASAAVALPEALGFEVDPVEPVLPPPPDPLRAVPDLPDTTALDAARESLAEAEEAYAAAAARHEETEAEVDRLQAMTRQVRAELDDLRRRLAETEQRAQDTEDDLTTAETLRADAAETLTAARQAKEEAAAEVTRLEQG